MRLLGPLQGILEAFVRRALNDPNGVADVLQSGIGSAFSEFHVYAEGTNFRAWIFRFVHLEALNHNRKTRRTRHAPLPEDLPADHSWELANEEPMVQRLLENPTPILERCDEALARAITGLPEVDRDVFLLRAIGEFKYREIADILRMPVGTVMSSLSRSRARLRLALAGPYQRAPSYADRRGDGTSASERTS